MKIKIFLGNYTDELENKMAEWTRDLNPNIISINLNAHVMNDYYVDSAPPMVCNTWIEYIATIVYELPNIKTHHP